MNDQKILEAIEQALIGNYISSSNDVKKLSVKLLTAIKAELPPTDLVKVTERGWAGHFICADRCRFRRNTLISYKDINIVVSTVGLMEKSEHWRKEGESRFEKIGLERYFETMAFHSDKADKRYLDADVSKQVDFNSDWSINEMDADDKANDMHDVVVKEISERLLNGETFEVKS